MASPYLNSDHPWGVEPKRTLVPFFGSLKSGTTLDLGVGDGRNALWIAGLGQYVVGIDKDVYAIEKLLHFAQVDGVAHKISGIVADMAEWQFDQEYDNIITTFALHFVPETQFAGLMIAMRNHTAIGGLHIIEDFTANGPLYRPESTTHWIGPEIQLLYPAPLWQILHFRVASARTRATNENGESMTQETIELIARKCL